MALAEKSAEAFEMTVALLKDAKAVDLDEHGTHEGGDGTSDPSADLEKRAVALAEAEKIDYADAYAKVMASDSSLAERRFAELTERIANT